jgi:hypothetical protein
MIKIRKGSEWEDEGVKKRITLVKQRQRPSANSVSVRLGFRCANGDFSAAWECPHRGSTGPVTAKYRRRDFDYAAIPNPLDWPHDPILGRVSVLSISVVCSVARAVYVSHVEFVEYRSLLSQTRDVTFQERT